MYCADEAITIVQFDRKTQQYRCTVIDGVSWHTVCKRYLQTTDAPEARVTTVRIPEDQMPDALTIEAGDIVCRGRVSNINRRADLEQHERFEVTEVRDNRRGLRLRHWAVIGA